MAVRGSVAKTDITNKLLSVFEGAFVSGKEIRIPWVENGEKVEIKVSLTCAKDLLGGAEATAESAFPAVPSATPVTPAVTALTEDEKTKVSNLLASLGL